MLLIISIFAFSQDLSFRINNKQVEWEKIFNTEKKLSNIKSTLLLSGKLKFISETENSLIGEFGDFLMDYKGAGFTQMGTPMYLNSNNRYSANFKIDIKEGKYRVTIFNIKFKGMQMSLYSGGVGMSGNNENNIEEYLLKNNKEQFKGSFNDKPYKILDYSFTNLFDVSKYQNTSNDNW